MSEKEDLSALKREDLVYKAKLAEQAERCEATRGDATDARTRARRADARPSVSYTHLTLPTILLV